MAANTKNAAIWVRVSTGHQDTDKQVPDVEEFAAHHGHLVTARYVVSDTAWKNGGGPEYRKTLRQALDDAHAGKFSVLIVWSLDRIVRDDESGAEAALRLFRQFRQRGCTIISVKESWLNAAPEVQDVLIAFAGWMAERESSRRSERIKNGLARRKAEGLPVGRQQGARDTGRRKRAGYVASWEGGERRAAHAEGQRRRQATTQASHQARAAAAAAAADDRTAGA